jgi:hypothetical protein
MHPDLEKWLNDVWQRRNEIFKGFTQTGRAIHQQPLEEHKGVGRIYSMYTNDESAGAAGSGGDGAGLSVFLLDVAKIIEKRQAICEIQSRGFWPASAEALVNVANGNSLTWSWEPRDADDPGEFVVSPQSIIYDFIHVRHKINYAKKGIDQRIYLNLAADGRGAHFAAIVDAVYDHDGFRSSKVSCPGSPPRNDTALLYVAGEAAVKFALERLKEFQKSAPGAFLPGLPRLTSPVAGLVGVGRGMEPPSYAVIRQGGNYYKLRASMSFGWWRSALIFMALDRTYWTREGQSDSQRCAAFKRRAAKYFRAAGIDPDNPSVQTNPDNLPDYRS